MLHLPSFSNPQLTVAPGVCTVDKTWISTRDQKNHVDHEIWSVFYSITAVRQNISNPTACQKSQMYWIAWWLCPCNKKTLIGRGHTSNFLHAASSLPNVMRLSCLLSPSDQQRAANTVCASSYWLRPKTSPVINAINSARVTFPSLTMASIRLLAEEAPFFPLSRSKFEPWLWKPSAIIANSSSFLSMEPPPSVSKSAKISLIWFSCASDNTIWWLALSTENGSGVGGGRRSGLMSKLRERCRATRVQ